MFLCLSYYNGKLELKKKHIDSHFYVRAGILLTCGKHLHDRIISLREEVWADKTSLTLPLSIEVLQQC